jgi:pectate lyase
MGVPVFVPSPGHPAFMKQLLLLVALMLSVAVSSNGQVVGPKSFTNSNVIRVDVNGNDDNAMIGRWDRPFATITNAITKITNGTHMFIGPGEYSVDVLMSNAAAYSHLKITNVGNVTIEGSGPETVITLSHPTNCAGIGFWLQTTTNLTFKNFTIRETNKSARLYPGGGDYLGMIVLDGYHEGLLFDGVRFLDGSQHGIGHLSGGKSNYFTTIRNCYFRNLGCTNHGTLGIDGAANATSGPNLRSHDNVFVECLRDQELESQCSYWNTGEGLHGCSTPCLWNKWRVHLQQHHSEYDKPYSRRIFHKIRIDMRWSYLQHGCRGE